MDTPQDQSQTKRRLGVHLLDGVIFSDQKKVYDEKRSLWRKPTPGEQRVMDKFWKKEKR